MQVLFVRHAPALSRANWLRDDLERPLSDKGIISAKKAFKELSKIYDAPNVIYTSKAVRAKETAGLLSKSFGGVKITESSLLNPGATFKDFKELLEGEESGCIALTGHEPDFGEIISAIVAHNSKLAIEVKKASLIEVDMDEEFRGILKAVIPPKIFN